MKKLIKSPSQIEKIRRSGEILSDVLKKLREEVKPGVISMDLENLARELIEDAGGTPAFLGYKPEGALHPFPYALCSSVNEVVVHGRPSEDTLTEGDIITLDLGVDWHGGISDAAVTIPVGRISEETKLLVNLTKRALDRAITQALPGKTLGDVGHIIEKTIVDGGGMVLDGLTGHGVGFEVHEEPIVYNFGEQNTGMDLREGMVIAIEPMVSMKTHEIKQLADDSFVTADGSNSAQFEHTVLITKSGNEVLTR